MFSLDSSPFVGRPFSLRFPKNRRGRPTFLFPHTTEFRYWCITSRNKFRYFHVVIHFPFLVKNVPNNTPTNNESRKPSDDIRSTTKINTRYKNHYFGDGTFGSRHMAYVHWFKISFHLCKLLYLMSKTDGANEKDFSDLISTSDFWIEKRM